LKILWVSELSGGKLDQPKRQEKKRQPQKEHNEKEAGNNCYFCHEPGHIAADCAELARTKCKKCAKLGHTQNFCNSVLNVNKESKQYSVRWSGKANRSEVQNWRKQVASVETTE